MPANKKTDRAVKRNRSSAVHNKRQQVKGAPLRREQIVKTALALVDREGLKALSMRRLGAEMGVDPMAVYYHIPNKQALLDAIVEAVMAGIDLSVDHPGDSPEQRILTAAQAYRDVMLAHVNALPIVLAHGPATPVAMRPVELLIGILRDAGLSPAQAFAGMQLIAAAVRGAVGMGPAPEGVKPPGPGQIEAMLRIFPPGEFPNLLEAMPYAGEFFESGFEFGVRIVARGLIAEAKKTEKQESENGE
ncbi:MAG: TetR/AcrR family transcriptional regulator C-terminal domain-containing protein [Terracidiphilus sp.]